MGADIEGARHDMADMAKFSLTKQQPIVLV